MKRFVFLIIIALCFTLCACSDKSSTLYTSTEIQNGKLKYGFIDRNGQKPFDKLYDDVLSGFKDGYAVVVSDKNINIINTKGESPITDKLTNVLEIKNGLAIASSKGKSHLYELSGGKSLFDYDYIKMQSNDMFAYAKDGKWGYRNLDGTKQVSPRYDEVNPFGKNNAVVVRDNDVYILSKDGKERPTEYHEAVSIENQPYIIASGTHTSLLDIDGNVLIKDIPGSITECAYDRIVIYVRHEGKLKKAVYDVKGGELVAPRFDDVRLLSKDYFAAVDNKGRFALFNMNGERLTEYLFSYIDAEFFDINGGFFTAINADTNEPAMLDKNGVIQKNVPKLSNALWMKKDKYVYTVETNDSINYYDNDLKLIGSYAKSLNEK